MTNNFKIVLALIIGFLCSCNYSNKNKKLIVTKDQLGVLKSEINYIDDSVKDGVAKFYYYPKPKNKLETEVQYKNGLKDGWYKHFYRENGSLECKVYFKRDLQNGESFCYYLNGNLKQYANWLKGKLYGLAKWFYENGTLRLVNNIDQNGTTLYVIQYDSFGNKIRDTGLIFSRNFVAQYNDDSIPILSDTIISKKEVTVNIATTVLPDRKTYIWMGQENSSKLIKLNISNYTATYKVFFPEAGTYNFITVGELRDIKGRLLKKDSLVTKVVVKT